VLPAHQLRAVALQLGGSRQHGREAGERGAMRGGCSGLGGLGAADLGVLVKGQLVHAHARHRSHMPIVLLGLRERRAQLGGLVERQSQRVLERRSGGLRLPTRLDAALLHAGHVQLHGHQVELGRHLVAEHRAHPLCVGAR
jgi:hypothetical protein